MRNPERIPRITRSRVTQTKLEHYFKDGRMAILEELYDLFALEQLPKYLEKIEQANGEEEKRRNDN